MMEVKSCFFGVMTVRSVDATTEIGYSSQKDFWILLNRAGLAEGQPGSVGGAEKRCRHTEGWIRCISCLLGRSEVCAVVDIEGDQGAVLLELADTFDRELLCVAAES